MVQSIMQEMVNVVYRKKIIIIFKENGPVKWKKYQLLVADCGLTKYF